MVIRSTPSASDRRFSPDLMATQNHHGSSKHTVQSGHSIRYTRRATSLHNGHGHEVVRTLSASREQIYHKRRAAVCSQRLARVWAGVLIDTCSDNAGSPMEDRVAWRTAWRSLSLGLWISGPSAFGGEAVSPISHRGLAAWRRCSAAARRRGGAVARRRDLSGRRALSNNGMCNRGFRRHPAAFNGNAAPVKYISGEKAALFTK